MSNIDWTQQGPLDTISSMRPSFAKDQIARLVGDFTHTLRDPLWRDVPLSPGFKRLLTCEAMQKLGRIKQLGPVHLLYPGAVHTRLDHSLGVFHASRLIMLALLTASLHEGPPRLEFSQEGIQALLAAAMLHDLGHFPYAHALKGNVSREHESLGAEIIAQDAEIGSVITNQLGTSIDAVCQIIDPALACQDAEIAFYRTILSGTLDPDKLDYLSRDALFCGIPYGVQDASYIIRHLQINEKNTLCIPIEAIGAVEHLLFAKYLMYRNVYWHQVTRGATAMIKKAVFLALQADFCNELQLFGLDDESFWTLFSQIKEGDVFQLVQHVRNNNLLKVKTELSFADSNPYRQLATDQANRTAVEEQIRRRLLKRYAKLTPADVIIDIPEDVSFEADIPILLDDMTIKNFSIVDELFTKPVVDAFTNSISKLRLFLPDYIAVSDASKVLFEELGDHA